MKHYSPTGRRNHFRILRRLLGTWDRNGSTSGPTPWQIDDDDDEVFIIFLNTIGLLDLDTLQCSLWLKRVGGKVCLLICWVNVTNLRIISPVRKT
jgi:hypothetical protein